MKILNLGNRVVNQYLVELNDGFLLIDTGYSNGYKRFIKNLSKHRIQKEQIKYVFITHAHDDHIGFLAELLNNFPHITLITNLLSKNIFFIFAPCRLSFKYSQLYSFEIAPVLFQESNIKRFTVRGVDCFYLFIVD